MHSVRVPLWQTQSVGPVRTAHISVLQTVNILCHTIQHRAVLIIFPLNLQTITITRMWSGGGQGFQSINQVQCTVPLQQFAVTVSLKSCTCTLVHSFTYDQPCTVMSDIDWPAIHSLHGESTFLGQGVLGCAVFVLIFIHLILISSDENIRISLRYRTTLAH